MRWGSFVSLQNIYIFTRYEGLDVGFGALQAGLDLRPLAALATLSDEEVLYLLQLFLRMLIVLVFLDRLGVTSGLVWGRASFVGQLILVLLVL